MMKKIFIIGLTCIWFIPIKSFAEWNNTPDYWKCYDRVSGSWTFGIAPYGCNANAFGSDNHLTNNYEPVIFKQQENYSTERSRYMQETHAMLKDAAEYYIKSRKPNVSENEVSAFQHATLAIAHQESFWSHYRKASQDGRYKMMRGDFGHGHGLMQVDDRAHYTATTNGSGWELITNVLYSLDEYYTAWKGADSKWCIQSYGNTWRNRSREAYSQYNGGPSSSCRWTNPNHKWARNDKGFAEKYDNRSWENYVADKNQPSNINISCLANGGTFCPPGTVNTDEWYNKLLQTSLGEACVFDGQELHCMADMRHSACLVSVGLYDTDTILQLEESDTNGINKRIYDPHSTCFDNVTGLASVGEFIRLKTAINLRKTPNGDLIHQIPQETVLQVTDIAVFDSEALKRFYRVTHNGQTGYIWGSTKDEYGQWYERVNQKADSYQIPVAGDWVSINVNLLNFRATPGGEIIDTLKQGTKVLVKGVLTESTTNKVFLHIEDESQEGYIYAGYQLPESTLDYWVKSASSTSPNVAAYCPEGSEYNGQLKVCQNETDTYGPFTREMIERCVVWGGGDACEEKVTVQLNGRQAELHRWATDWYMNVRENSQCPLGAFRHIDYGWHCVEENSSGVISDVYGPFGTPLVDRCLETGGGTACYFNRWSAPGFLNWSRP